MKEKKNRHWVWQPCSQNAPEPVKKKEYATRCKHCTLPEDSGNNIYCPFTRYALLYP